LGDSPTLDQILPGIAVTSDRGLSATRWPGVGRLAVPIGIVDKPAEQRQDPQVVDLSGAGGHVLVVGGPRSGKSTALRTLMFSLALTHTPAEARFLCLDFGGGAFGELVAMPHVSAVAGRSEPDLARRVVAEVVGTLDRREARAGSQAKGRLAASGSFTKGRSAFGEHVFLVIDGWAAFRTEFEALEADLVDVARRGLGFGVHLLVSAGRWADVRSQLKDAVTTRIELRLGDPMESEMDRRAAAEVPLGLPGRGITKARLHTLGALPETDADTLSAAIGKAWTGPRAPKVRMLPSQVSYDELLKPAEPSGIPRQRTPEVVIGVDEQRLAPIGLDFASEPHFLVFGEGESGKSNFLRLLARGVCDAAEQGEGKAMFVVIDYRRSLMDAVPNDYLVSYNAAAPAAVATVNDLLPALKSRLPGPDVTPDQLRRRNWWSGKDVYVLVDDYDLVATTTGNPLSPLVELLPYARDIGLHLILARQTGGAGRAQFDPVIQRLRELNCPGLLLSGDRDEGQLIGGSRPSRQPAGRGQLVTRRTGAVLVQTALMPDAE
jgi:S-DNA-T family DNA segregation ATPase FtsK/SpoIIIE